MRTRLERLMALEADMLRLAVQAEQVARDLREASLEVGQMIVDERLVRPDRSKE